ncbi:MAG: flagellar assembly protein FliW [bacterium]|nr:flagellar assembly protein FliW [bacterium]
MATITLKTKPFGEIEIDDQLVVDFPDGILGFDFIKKFVILESDGDNSPFKWLQAYDEPELAFVIISPEDFLEEYELLIPRGELEMVGVKKADELVVYVIVNIPTNPSEMTANLQGPVIVNLEKKLGRQSISLSDKYGVRHMILEEMQKASGEG